MIEIIPAKKGRGLDDLLRDYSPQTPEETRKATTIYTSTIEQTIKIFEPCLEPELDLDEIEKMAEKDTGLLRPAEIDLFLQASIKYDGDPWYGGAMGIFISVLLKKSIEEGYKEFTLNTGSLTSRLHNLWSTPQYPPIQLTVNGPVGQYFGSWARNSYLHVLGEADDYPGGNAENSTFVFGGNVEEFFGTNLVGQLHLNTTYIFHGEVGRFSSRGVHRLTFKTSNERTLTKLIDKIGTQPGNRLYFINSAATEVLVQDYDGKLQRE